MSFYTPTKGGNNDVYYGSDNKLDKDWLKMYGFDVSNKIHVDILVEAWSLKSSDELKRVPWIGD